MNFKSQGIHAKEIFGGRSNNLASKLVYAESCSLFSQIIRKNFQVGKYKVLDIGSHGGDFLRELIDKLPEYEFDTTALELNGADLDRNIANHKILSDAKSTSLPSKDFDITLSRYVLAWNNFEDQKHIISEICRLTKGIAIIQHQGADANKPLELQAVSSELFSGAIFPLKRSDFYFSSEKELENFFGSSKINYSIVQSRKIQGLADILIEKYSLSKNDSDKTRQILNHANYIVQSTFVLNFKPNS